MSEAAVTLYSTDGCHLCELAAQQLHQLAVAFTTVDIIDDPDLVERYGITIPVVANNDGNELNWPFEIDQLAHFLENNLC